MVPSGSESSDASLAATPSLFRTLSASQPRNPRRRSRSTSSLARAASFRAADRKRRPAAREAMRPMSSEAVLSSATSGKAPCARLRESGPRPAALPPAPPTGTPAAGRAAAEPTPPPALHHSASRGAKAQSRPAKPGLRPPPAHPRRGGGAGGVASGCRIPWPGSPVGRQPRAGHWISRARPRARRRPSEARAAGWRCRRRWRPCRRPCATPTRGWPPRQVLTSSPVLTAAAAMTSSLPRCDLDHRAGARRPRRLPVHFQPCSRPEARRDDGKGDEAAVSDPIHA